MRWSFILTALKFFGFGDHFCESVQTLFVDPETCVYNSGFTSPYFYPNNGVRQGCCVSPLLFIIAVELMAIMVRCNSSIKGVTVDKAEYKISQFADDATCFVSTPASATAVLETLKLFETFSGLQINPEKSAVLLIGPHTDTPSSVAGLKSEDKAKILGVWFSNCRNHTDHYEWNFKQQIQKMKNTCQSWANRTLSYKGKGTVLNVLVISLLQYVITNTITPKRVFPEVKKIACDFLWAGKRNKIAYNTVI